MKENFVVSISKDEIKDAVIQCRASGVVKEYKHKGVVKIIEEFDFVEVSLTGLSHRSSISKEIKV